MSIQTSKIYLSNVTNTQTKKKNLFTDLKSVCPVKTVPQKGIHKQENSPSHIVYCWQQRCFTASIAFIRPLQNKGKT